MEKSTNNLETVKKLDAGSMLAKYGTIFAMVAVFIFFSIAADRFLEFENIINILRQVSTLAVVSFGLTVTMAAGDFDMSVGSIIGLCGVVVTGLLVKGYGVAVSIIGALLVGALLGTLNGVISTRVGIPSIIVTLATSSIATGINYMYTKGKAVYGGIPEGFVKIGRGYVLGIPIPIIIMAIIAIIVYIFLNNTVMGRYIYAVGGNATSAKLSGIDTLKYRTLGLMISGLFAGITGILLSARLGSGQPSAGVAFQMDALAAVFIGMTTIKIGRPNLVGTLIGVALIGMINNGLNLLGLPFYVQDMAKGIIMIAAVSFAASKNELKFFAS